VAACLPWTPLADGLQRARLGRGGSGLRARPGRVGFYFFEFIFNAKTIPEKSRNFLKARKIIQKSQKLQENSQS
jgi:hypothetical protein